MSPQSFRTASANQAGALQLLDGENPDSTDPTDAWQWRQVYAELVEFTRQILSFSQELQPDLAPDGAGESLRSDIEPLARQLSRLVSRLEFWEQKAGAVIEHREVAAD